MNQKHITAILVFLMLNACSQEAEHAKKKKPAHLVETAEASRSNVDVSITRTGTLKVLREVKIHSQEAGRVTELPYYEGDKVNKGTLIARLDDKLLRAQFNRAAATLKKSQQDIKRMRGLHKRKLASDQEIANAETEYAVAKADKEVLETRLGYTRIVAPLTGIVTQRLTEPGNIAERHSHLLTIADPTSLITEVTVSGLLLPELTVGDPVQVTIDALGSEHFQGVITRTHPSLDPVTRRGIIEVELSPVPAGALPGQLCRVTLNTHTGNRLLIPFRALRRDTEGEYVFIVNIKNKAERVAVTSGLRTNEQIEILPALKDGLTDGQQVITKGFLSLKAGKKIKSVTKRASPSEETDNTKPHPAAAPKPE